MADTKETVAERAAVAIPDDWRDLPWFALRALAAKLTDAPVNDKAGAVAAVEAEEARRGGPAGDDQPAASAPTTKVADLPKRAGAGVDIPAGWHDRLSVAEIVALAARIDPDGNPVDVIRAEEARRAAA